MTDSKQILTPNQVAELMMVSPATIRQWAAKGLLKALTTPGGHRRFRMSDIMEYADTQGITLNIEENDSVSILIVDDDKQFSGYLEEFILGFDESINVKAAYDGFETGKFLHTIKPDLIFMDLMMPTMDGFDTCRNIKSDPQTADIRIIAMTGFGSERNMTRIIDMGAEVCLSKPINEDVLEQYIKSVLV